MSRDAFAQRRQAERRDVADAVVVERGVRSEQRLPGRRRAGLADLEMDNRVAGRLFLRSRGHDIHDDERVDGNRTARWGT